jgi:hypothetical protein
MDQIWATCPMIKEREEFASDLIVPGDLPDEE